MTKHPSAALRFAMLSREAEALGALYDAAPMYPDDSVALLVRTGLHAVFSPVESGGQCFSTERAENAAMLDCLRLVGRADLSLGRIFEGHVNALKLFDWYGSKRQKERLRADLANGLLYGVWATEPEPGVAITADASGWRLSGGKSFATGAGGLARAIVTARPTDGPRRLAIVPANLVERADASGWKVRGMRATVSGTYDLEALRLSEDDLLGAPGDYDREPKFTAGGWRFCAVQLGGIESLLAETRTAMTTLTRADPLQRAKFGAGVVAARTAYLWVREAASRAAQDHPDAVAFVQMTRGIVERAALDVMEFAARIVGTRSAFDGQRIDKISRDLSLYLRQAGQDHARDQAAIAWLDHDVWSGGDELW